MDMRWIGLRIHPFVFLSQTSFLNRFKLRSNAGHGVNLSACDTNRLQARLAAFDTQPHRLWST